MRDPETLELIPPPSVDHKLEQIEARTALMISCLALACSVAAVAISVGVM